MSKTTAQIAQAFGATNERLFDRYINLTLYQKKPKVKSSAQVKSMLSFDIFNMPSVQLGTTDFAIITPATGLKPSITISGQFQLSNTANIINITVYNVNANIDTMAYNWVEVEAGYTDSGVHATFLGQITNCYMAKPNPNGELVISAVSAKITDLYARGDFEVEFKEELVTTDKLIQTCVDAMKKKYPELLQDVVSDSGVSKYSADVMPNAEIGTSVDIPLAWKSQSFAVGKATRHFRSAFECIAWMNSLFATYTYSTGYASGPGGAPESEIEASQRKKLPPLRLGFDSQGKFSTFGIFKASPASMRSLFALGSAFMTSTSSATLTAPFNPGIMPGEVIAVDPQYFKTRVNISEVREAYKSMGNMWRVVSTSFTFSTQTTNTMTLNLVNVDNVVTAVAG